MAKAAWWWRYVVGVGLLLCTSAASVAQEEQVIDINVQTGETTLSMAPARDRPDGEAYQAWSTDPLDLSGMEIRNAGEDATGSMDPKTLILRSLGRLPDTEQARIGLTAMIEAAGGPENVLLEDLRELWERRQGELREAIEAMSETADTLQELLVDLEAAGRAGDSGAQLAALSDLDDHLSDLDNARDFHDALGGWPVLAQLLSPMPRWRLVLLPQPEAGGEEEAAEGVVGSAREAAAAAARAEAAARLARPPTRPAVMAAAALVVGTAAKHEAGFKGWALESTVEPVALQQQRHGSNNASSRGSRGSRGSSAVAGVAEAEEEEAPAPGDGGGVGGSVPRSARAAALISGGRTAARYPTAVPANETVLSALVDLLRTGGSRDGDEAAAAAAATGEETAAAAAAAERLLVRRRALYALGSVVRHNPLAQALLLELDPHLDALAAAFPSPHPTTTTTTTTTGPDGDGGGGGSGGGEAGEGGEGADAPCPAALPNGAEWGLRTKAAALAMDLLAEADAHAEEVREAPGGGGGGGGKEEEEDVEVAGRVRLVAAALARALRSGPWRARLGSNLLSCRLPAGGNGGDGGGWGGAPAKAHETALRAVAAQWAPLCVSLGAGNGGAAGGGGPAAPTTTSLSSAAAAPGAHSQRQARGLSAQCGRLAQRYAAMSAASDEDPEDGYFADISRAAEKAVAAMAPCVPGA